MAHDRFGGLTGWDFEGFHGGGDTELWKRLGSEVVTVEDDERGPVTGVRFAVWAPNAKSVSIIGDFNWWTGDPMELIPGSGVWGTFIGAFIVAVLRSGLTQAGIDSLYQDIATGLLVIASVALDQWARRRNR